MVVARVRGGDKGMVASLGRQRPYRPESILCEPKDRKGVFLRPYPTEGQASGREEDDGQGSGSADHCSRRNVSARLTNRRAVQAHPRSNQSKYGRPVLFLTVECRNRGRVMRLLP